MSNELIDSSIFKSYDIRGLVGEQLNSMTSQRIGSAFSSWLKNPGKVVVGRDMRPESLELANAFIKGLVESGRSVVDIGLVTSDMAVFAVNQLEAAGAAIVTASHNPGKYNGIKLYDSTPKTIGIGQGLEEIRDLCLTSDIQKYSNEYGSVDRIDLTYAWIDFCIEKINPNIFLNRKIAIDCGNGMAGHILPELLSKLRIESQNIYFDLDGNFPNHEANPQKLETLTDLKKVVTTNSCALGVAFDGDGDRMAIIDDKSSPLSGSETLSILASRLKTGDSFVHEVRTSRKIISSLAIKGLVPHRAKAGRSNIGDLMRIKNAEFGGETTGHFFFKDYYFNDSGLLSMLYALETIFSSGMTLSEFRLMHKTASMIEETNFDCDNPDKTIENISKHFSDYTQDWLDGLTVELKNGWFNIRKSNTEPLIRLNCELNSQAELDKIVDEIKIIIKGEL